MPVGHGLKPEMHQLPAIGHYGEKSVSRSMATPGSDSA